MNAHPLHVVVVDDDELVAHGLAAMLAPYQDQVVVDEPVIDGPSPHADIALYDTFGRPDTDHGRLAELISQPSFGKVVVWTWNFQPWLAADSTQMGACGYLSKSLNATDLLNALVDVHAGKTVISPSASAGGEWPGSERGLTARESEVLTLITQGHSNADIAAMTCLSINSIKSYIRSCYRKIDVGSRSQAVLWGIEHGMRPERMVEPGDQT